MSADLHKHGLLSRQARFLHLMEMVLPHRGSRDLDEIIGEVRYLQENIETYSRPVVDDYRDGLSPDMLGNSVVAAVGAE